MSKMFETAQKAAVCKVDEALGLVFGFAIVSTLDGEPYYDAHEDHIPDESMLKASFDFMLSKRESQEMHDGDQDGTVVFAFPLTADIAKSLGIETEKTGLLIGMRPSPAVFGKFLDGTYTGFSIGGRYIELEDAA